MSDRVESEIRTDLFPPAETAPAAGQAADQDLLDTPLAAAGSPPPQPRLRRMMAGSADAARRAGSSLRGAAGRGREALGAASERSGPIRKPALAAAALLSVTALGYAGGRLAVGSAPEPAASAKVVEAASAARETRDDTIRLTAELKSLKSTVDGLKSERDRARGELSARQSALADRTDKTASDTATRLAKLADQVDRLEKSQRDPNRAGMADRLERMERQIQAATTPIPPPKPTAAAAAAEVTQTGSLAESKAAKSASPARDDRRPRLTGYWLREVGERGALIETRSGRLYEAVLGAELPWLGRVEGIERRGREWVVLTPRGLIGER